MVGEGDFMTKKLFLEAIVKYLSGVILVGLFIFLPAGTIGYFNGWLLMAVLFIPMFLSGIVMMITNPQLLVSRLKAKETQTEQSIIIKLIGFMFVIGFIVSGLDYRYSWFILSPEISCIFSVVLLLAYLMWAEVLRENTYLTRTIKVEKGQKVNIGLKKRGVFVFDKETGERLA